MHVTRVLEKPEAYHSLVLFMALEMAPPSRNREGFYVSETAMRP